MTALLSSPRLAVAVIVVGALAYPLVLLAQGGPSFPSRAHCLARATQDGNIELLLGGFSTNASADALVAKAKKYGLTAAESTLDGCGNFDVVVPGYTTLAGAQSAVAEAHTVDITAVPVVSP
jgi:hypothetical protein